MYNRETELRHISSADIFKLGQILEQTNSWKKLMRIIPKTITSTNNDQFDPVKKYNNDHIRLVENASIKQNRMSTEILFEEWSTSGKKRPTVGNLLELLIKAELFRAADFVAQNFLNEPPPERPLKGPAAKIDISLPLLKEDINEIEKILDDTHYPGTRTLLENVQTSSNMNNKDFYEKVIIDNKKLLSTNNIISNNVTTTITSNINSESNKQTDLIKFSSGNISENNIPILSELIHSNRNNDNSTTQILELSSSLPSSSAVQSGLNGSALLNDYNGICNQIKETEIDEIENRNIKKSNIFKNQQNMINSDLPNLSVLNGTSDNNDYENSYNENENKDDGDDYNNSENNDNGDDDDDDDGIDYDDERSQNESILNDSSISSISHDLNAPHLSILDQSNGSNNSSNGILNDSSLTTVTETSDDSSFSCGEKDENKQTDGMDNDSINIPCISALNN